MAHCSLSNHHFQFHTENSEQIFLCFHRVAEVFDRMECSLMSDGSNSGRDGSNSRRRSRSQIHLERRESLSNERRRKASTMSLSRKSSGKSASIPTQAVVKSGADKSLPKGISIEHMKIKIENDSQERNRMMVSHPDDTIADIDGN